MSAPKLVSVFLVLLVNLLILVPHSFAQGYTPTESANTALITLENFISCSITGSALIPNGLCPTVDKSGSIKMVSALPEGGALQGVGKAMALLYTSPPTSTTYYLANAAEELGLVQSAYAQTNSVGGSGDGVLQPILKIWEIIRNLAYLCFIFIFIAVGFMVMFRSKIDPQTVISIQAALPGLVIGLVLVTFSYFISALLTDTAFLGTRLAAEIFYKPPEINNIIEKPKELATNLGFVDLFGQIVKGTTKDKDNNLLKIAGITSNAFVNNFFNVNIRGANTKNNWWDFVLDPGKGAAALLGGIVGYLVAAVIFIALIIQMFRLLWALLSAYITILVTTILSPLIILGASIPGRSSLLGLWWKSLLANALVFPAVFLTFLFAGMFLHDTNPQSYIKTLPFFSGIPTGLLPIIIGYGIMLGSPAIPKMVKDALGVKDQELLGKTAMGGAAAGAGVLGGATKGGYGTAMKATGLAASKERVEKENVTGARIPPAGSWRKRALEWMPKP